MDINRGRLEPFYEQGMEGVHWVLFDIRKPGYSSICDLANGDKLTVYDGEGDILWSGIINLNIEWNGMTQIIHQVGCDDEKWSRMFEERRRAILEKKKYQTHPFMLPINEMYEYFESLDDIAIDKLVKSSIYSWLHFYSNGTWGSYALEWGLDLNEIIQMLHLSNDNILEMQNFRIPKMSVDFLMRLAALQALHAELDWKFDNVEYRKFWINNAAVSIDVKNPKELILTGELSNILLVHEMATKIPFGD